MQESFCNSIRLNFNRNMPWPCQCPKSGSRVPGSRFSRFLLQPEFVSDAPVDEAASSGRPDEGVSRCSGRRPVRLERTLRRLRLANSVRHDAVPGADGACRSRRGGRAGWRSVQVPCCAAPYRTGVPVICVRCMWRADPWLSWIAKCIRHRLSQKATDPVRQRNLQVNSGRLACA